VYNPCVGCCLKCLVGESVLVTSEIPKKPFAGQGSWEESIFGSKASVSFSSENEAKDGMNRLIEKLKVCDIFTKAHGDKSTVVTLPPGKEQLERDMCIAITTWLGGVKWFTSLERVCGMEFIDGEKAYLCIAASQENVIDGYYRIDCSRNGTSVDIDYAKVQSPNGFLGNLAGKDGYEDTNKRSAENTVKLFESFVRGSEDVAE